MDVIHFFNGEPKDALNPEDTFAPTHIDTQALFDELAFPSDLDFADVRGQRAEEMVHNLEEYLDEAEMLGVSNLRILHGKGNGILRSVVRQYLAKRQNVTEFHDEMLELGGAGITVVKLKK